MLLTAAIGVSGRSKRSFKDENAAKADYFFLEALRAKSQENHDATYELLKRAYDLNPSDNSIGSELSMYQLKLSYDSASFEKAMDMLRAYCDENPGAEYQNMRYALIRQQVGEIDENDALKNEALRIWERLHRLYPNESEYSMRLADALASMGEEGSRRAIAIYDSLEMQEGKSVPAISNRKIKIFYNNQDTAAVISEVDKVRATAPDNVDLMVFSAEMYLLMGMREQAKILFDSACIIDPTSGLANYSRANYYYEIGDTAAFENEILYAMKQEDLDLETKLDILRGYGKKIDQDSIQQTRLRELFDVLIEQYPHEHDIHSLYALYLASSKDYEGAAEQTEQALLADPSNVDEWQMLSSLYYQVDENDKAFSAVERALHYFPDNSPLLLMYGSRQLIDGNYDEALKNLDKAAETADSTNLNLLSNIYMTIGDVYYRKNDWDKSEEAYEKSLEYDPDNSMTLNNWAYYLAEQEKDLDKALEMIDRAVRLDPSNVNALDSYAWVHFKRKEYAEARKMIELALEADGENSAEVLEHAGDIYFMNGEPDLALEFWEKALKINPDSEMLKKKVTHKTYFFK